MADTKLANGAIKIGPLWNRTVFDPTHRLVKQRGRRICTFDEVKGLVLREYIAPDEEEQSTKANGRTSRTTREAVRIVATTPTGLSLTRTGVMHGLRCAPTM